MKIVKNPKRSRLQEDKLNTCLRVKLNGPPLEKFDAIAAAKKWTMRKNRRGLKPK